MESRVALSLALLLGLSLTAARAAEESEPTLSSKPERWDQMPAMNHFSAPRNHRAVLDLLRAYAQQQSPPRAPYDPYKPYDMRVRRKFHEVDSKGFDGDIFDEGFGDFSTMKRSH
ncbi:hypothetical protein HDE_09439 [Halotydeus destructor]|nr:hypothetical protein HDE_09439 [Halotydeus destructor]